MGTSRRGQDSVPLLASILSNAARDGDAGLTNVINIVHTAWRLLYDSPAPLNSIQTRGGAWAPETIFIPLSSPSIVRIFAFAIAIKFVD